MQLSGKDMSVVAKQACSPETTQKLTNTVTGTGNAMGPILLQNNRFPIQDGKKLKKNDVGCVKRSNTGLQIVSVRGLVCKISIIPYIKNPTAPSNYPNRLITTCFLINL